MKSPPATCQVCGQEVGDHVMVGCARCATFHHLDCWRYLGHCATYGCGSEFTEAELEAMGTGVAEYLAAPSCEAAGPAETCASCHRRWKLEKGARCHGCGRIYHGSCWEANGGCLQFGCRATTRQTQEEGHSLVSGLGDANCLICALEVVPAERVYCSSCGRPYHMDCWRPNRGCMRYDCRHEGATVPDPEPPPPDEIRQRAAELQRDHRDWSERRSLLDALLDLLFPGAPPDPPA